MKKTIGGGGNWVCVIQRSAAVPEKHAGVTAYFTRRGRDDENNNNEM